MDKIQEIKKLCEEKQIRMIDFKMTDIDGRWRHITIPVERFDENTFTESGLTAPIMDMRLLKRAIWYFCRMRIRPMWTRLRLCQR